MILQKTTRPHYPQLQLCSKNLHECSFRSTSHNLSIPITFKPVSCWQLLLRSVIWFVYLLQCALAGRRHADCREGKRVRLRLSGSSIRGRELLQLLYREGPRSNSRAIAPLWSSFLDLTTSSSSPLICFGGPR